MVNVNRKNNQLIKISTFVIALLIIPFLIGCVTSPKDMISGDYEEMTTFECIHFDKWGYSGTFTVLKNNTVGIYQLSKLNEHSMNITLNWPDGLIETGTVEPYYRKIMLSNGNTWVFVLN
jgi:hypothetical protein